MTAAPHRPRPEAPVTCGTAMEVPLMVMVAVWLVAQAEVLLTSGPKMSTWVPKSRATRGQRGRHLRQRR